MPPLLFAAKPALRSAGRRCGSTAAAVQMRESRMPCMRLSAATSASGRTRVCALVCQERRLLLHGMYPAGRDHRHVPGAPLDVTRCVEKLQQQSA